jgi:hypothetical protein
MARIREQNYRGDINCMRMYCEPICSLGSSRKLIANRIIVLRASPLQGASILSYIFRILSENISMVTIGGGYSMRISAQCHVYSSAKGEFLS